MKKTLRGISALAVLAISTGANAQLPDYGYYPAGHIITDIDGTSHNVDAILNSGKPIIIDAFADWCGPCWTYHVGGTLETVYNAIGDGGTGSVKIFGLEADAAVPESYISNAATGQGDWTLGGTVEYPLADDDMISGNINLAYYPTLVLVCPDRSTTEVGQVSATAWATAVAACPGLSADDNDPRLVGNATPSQVNICGGGAVSTDVKVVVQNYSTASITGSYSFEAKIGGAVVATLTTTLTLAPYATTEVNLGSVALAIGTNNIDVKITTPNDDLTNDDIVVVVNAVNAYDLGIGDIVVKSTFDGYGSEVGYGLASGMPATEDPFAAYPMFGGGTYPGQVDFKAIGTWTNASAGFNEDYTSLAVGCYHLYMFDNYGDGLTAGGGGTLLVKSPNSGETYNIDVDYGSGAAFLFEITTAGTGGFSGIEDLQVIESAKVFPNPTADQTTVQFELNESSTVSIELINALGQVVYSNNLGEVNGVQTININATDLATGLYLINLKINGEVITKQLSVVK